MLRLPGSKLLLVVVVLLILALWIPTRTLHAQCIDEDDPCVVEDPVVEALASGLLLACIGIWLVTGIALMVWVFNDATRRNANRWLWLPMVFVLNVAGLAIYLIVRPKIVKHYLDL